MISVLVSGGQTGADRAALQWAVDHDIPYDGWVPRGRAAEDGKVMFKNLKETPSSSYTQRTEWNIRDTDATVIFTSKLPLDGGSKLTESIARRLKKPCCVIECSTDSMEHKKCLIDFLKTHRPSRLNVAGQRASKAPKLQTRVECYLDALHKEGLFIH